MKKMIIKQIIVGTLSIAIATQASAMTCKDGNLPQFTQTLEKKIYSSKLEAKFQKDMNDEISKNLDSEDELLKYAQASRITAVSALVGAGFVFFGLGIMSAAVGGSTTNAGMLSFAFGSGGAIHTASGMSAAIQAGAGMPALIGYIFSRFEFDSVRDKIKVSETKSQSVKNEEEIVRLISEKKNQPTSAVLNEVMITENNYIKLALRDLDTQKETLLTNLDQESSLSRSIKNMTGKTQLEEITILSVFETAKLNVLNKHVEFQNTLLKIANQTCVLDK